MSLYWLFLLCPVAYLFGNISWAVIVSKKFKNDDIRTKGSGNPGTMNMMRNYGFLLGILTLLLDALKGALPALVAMLLYGFDTPIGRAAMLGVGFCAVIGHVFPVFNKFKGGKGVATTFGVFCVTSPFVSLIALVVAAITLLFIEYGVLASFCFITILTIWEGLNPLNQNNLTVSILLFAIFFISWYLHRKNIARLLIGKENKVTLLKKVKGKKKAKIEKYLNDNKDNIICE